MREWMSRVCCRKLMKSNNMNNQLLCIHLSPWIFVYGTITSTSCKQSQYERNFQENINSERRKLWRNQAHFSHSHIRIQILFGVRPQNENNDYWRWIQLVSFVFKFIYQRNSSLRIKSPMIQSLCRCCFLFCFCFHSNGRRKRINLIE